MCVVMLSVITLIDCFLGVIMLIQVRLSIIMLSEVMLSVAMNVILKVLMSSDCILRVVILSVFIPNVMAPSRNESPFKKIKKLVCVCVLSRTRFIQFCEFINRFTVMKALLSK
jgi:hypothetical protein